MNGLQKRIAQHIKNGKYYDKHLKNDKIQILKKNNSNSGAYWIYSLLVDDKMKFRRFLKKYGIETDEVHIRNDKYSVFKSHSAKKLIGTVIKRNKECIISLSY